MFTPTRFAFTDKILYKLSRLLRLLAHPSSRFTAFALLSSSALMPYMEPCNEHWQFSVKPSKVLGFNLSRIFTVPRLEIFWSSGTFDVWFRSARPGQIP